jgi:hypothetical protein
VTLPATTAELIRPPAAVITPAKVMSAQEMKEYAQALSTSTFLPQHFRGNEANVIYAIELGRSYNLEPVSIMKNIHVFDDGQGRLQAALSADLMVSLARNAGHTIHVKANPNQATASLVRHELFTMDVERLRVLAELGINMKDYLTFTETWSLQDANTAGLAGKQNWKKYPREMLKARVKAAIVRAAASEVLIQMSDVSARAGGLVIDGQRIMPVTTHTADELGASITDEGEVIVERDDRPRFKRRSAEPNGMNDKAPAPPSNLDPGVVEFIRAKSADEVAEWAAGVLSDESLSVQDKAIRLKSAYDVCEHLGRLESPVNVDGKPSPLGIVIRNAGRSLSPAK